MCQLPIRQDEALQLFSMPTSLRAQLMLYMTFRWVPNKGTKWPSNSQTRQPRSASHNIKSKLPCRRSKSHHNRQASLEMPTEGLRTARRGVRGACLGGIRCLGRRGRAQALCKRIQRSTRTTRGREGALVTAPAICKPLVATRQGISRPLPREAEVARAPMRTSAMNLKVANGKPSTRPTRCRGFHTGRW